MTTATKTTVSDRRREDRSDDQYGEVLGMFEHLQRLEPGSPEYTLQRERIVVRCLPLADHVARHYRQRGQSPEDLTQVARVGLVNAVNRFDPVKGSDFIAFAVPTMMGEVRRYFRDHSWSMHVPRRIRDLHVQISRSTDDLTHELNRAPTAGELARTLGVDREDIIECLVSSQAYQVDSLDAPTSAGDTGRRSVGDRIGSIDPGIDLIDDREAVRPLLMALPERERTVLQMRFFESMTQSQIAERIGVSQMQVSRILMRTLESLRCQLTSEVA